MTILTAKQRTLVYIAQPNHVLNCMVFNEMGDNEILRLAHEYGIDKKHICAINHIPLLYRRQLDDSTVREILERLPQKERHTPEELLAAVRCVVPDAVRVIG